jgi:hypothetical protein
MIPPATFPKIPSSIESWRGYTDQSPQVSTNNDATAAQVAHLSHDGTSVMKQSKWTTEDENRLQQMRSNTRDFLSHSAEPFHSNLMKEQPQTDGLGTTALKTVQVLPSIGDFMRGLTELSRRETPALLKLSHRWTNEENQKLKELTSAGLHDKEIASLFQKTINSIRCKKYMLRKKNKLPGFVLKYSRVAEEEEPEFPITNNLQNKSHSIGRNAFRGFGPKDPL